MAENLLYWVWLSQCFLPGSDKPNQLLMDFDSPEGFYENGLEQLEEIEYLTDAERSKIRRTSLDRAEFIIKECSRLKIQIITLEDSLYPSRLKDVFSAPLVLYALGNLQGMEELPMITVVGTRNASEYGKRVTGNICYEFARAGAVVVSGCAVGIDGYAHLGALKGGGRTIAVLGCGLDVNYPSAHRELKQQILRKNGALITELSPGTEPTSTIFPIRNRIMAGISLGTLVTEAPVQSGSLITAQLALDQGRDIFCVPPQDIYDSRCFGVVRFLRDGAVPVFCAKDVLSSYFSNYSHVLNVDRMLDDYTGSKASGTSGQDGGQEKAAMPTREKVVQQPNVSPTDTKDEEEDISKKPTPPSGLVPDERKVYDCLEYKPKSVDDIVSESGLDMQDVLAHLTALEVKGFAYSCSGARYGLLNKS